VDEGINGALSPRNKDTNSVKSDQQKTDSTLLCFIKTLEE